MTQWLVKGLIPEEHNVMLAGNPHSMKSWVIEELAICVATGTPLFNEFETKKKYCILIDNDTPTNVLNTRLNRIASGFGYDFVDIDNLTVLSMTDFQLSETKSINYVRSIFDLFPESIVLIDSLSTVSVRLDQNSTRDAMKIASQLNTLKAGGHNVVITHHTSLKIPNNYIPTPDEFERRIMGNTQLVAQCDTLIGVVRRESLDTISSLIPKSRRESLEVNSFVIGVREPADKSWAKVIVIEDISDSPTESSRRILPFFTKDQMTSVAVNDLKKMCLGAYRDYEIRDALKELEDHLVLIRETDIGKTHRFKYKLNPDFNNPHAITTSYWDELRV